MNLLGSANYDPAGAVSKATSSLLAMTALDTSNLRLAITVPSHGKVKFILAGTLTGATTIPTILLGVLNGATVLGRVTPQIFTGTQNAATQGTPFRAEFTATGLAAGAMNVDAAYAVQVVVAATNIKYGGPNTNAGANAWGGFVFEAWDPQPIPTATPGAANGLQICGANAATTYASLTSTGAFTVNGVSAVSQTGDSFARLGAPVGASISADVTGVQADTDNIQTRLPAALVSGRIDASVGAMAANVLTAAAINAAALNSKGDWNIGKTGYSLTQAFPSNFASLGISAGGHISNVDTLTTYTNDTPQTGDAFARLGVAGVGLTNLGDARIANLDATISGRMASYTQPSGFLAATFPTDPADESLVIAATDAIMTRIGTAGVGLTALGDARLAHLDADISSRSTFAGGAVASVTGNVGGSVGSVIGLTASNLDATISSRLSAAGYTAPDNTSIISIKAKTDNLPSDPADESVILAAIAALPSSGSAMTLTAAYDAAKTAAQPGDNMGSVTTVLNPVDVTGLDATLLDVPVSSRLAMLPTVPARSKK